MKKKLLSLALVFVMALTLLPTAAFATDDADSNPSTCEHVYTDDSDTCTLCGESKTAPVDDTTDDNNNDNNNDNNADDNTDRTTEKTTTPPGSDNSGGGTPTIPGSGSSSGETPTTPGSGNSGGGTTTDPTPPTTPTTGCGHTREKVDRGEPTCVKPGYLLAKGDSAWYCATCNGGTYYTTETGMETVSVTKIAATEKHTIPTEHTFASTDVSDKTHTYTCAVCGQKVSDDHVYESGKCKVCGFQRTVTPSPSGYVSITSAYVNSYSIDVTWRSDLADGTDFEIYVDGRYRVTVHPSKSSSGYFSATVDFSYYLDESYYIVDVYARDNSSAHDSIRVYNRYYDRDYDYWYSDRYYPNSTPSTNSSGIPYASQVNGRYSASEAIRILRNKNQGTLQYDLLNSSSASSSFYDLEQAVKRANNVSVQVDIDRGDVPGAIRNIQIVGAAFNASSTNSTVRLVVDAPTQGRYTGYGYAFSMSLTGVGGDSSLDVPVKITMPVPSDINANSVRILHYHNSNTPTVIEPKVSGSSMSFTVTGFSDFVVTDRRADPYYYYYYTPGVPASARRSIMEEHLAVVLPILASMPPSGYVFDDVGPGHWAAAEIAWARDGGMMSGYYDGTFRPYAATTRQELWMVLARLAGARPADMWAAREWAMNAGISDGRNPHSTLSVQQMITMLYRYAQYLGVDVGPQASLRGYRDSAAISGYARSAMAWAVEQGIVVGDGDNCLNPQNIATRADFAVYLYRFIY